ncbi:PAS domain S-box protein [Flavobacterium sp. F372]|uniref:histidine kinase n=1 Tax=Flavobacterium bernardetii TaxID=2813823 RepID=A0ABR7IX07_9FLAO|nr:PAS domain-containing sensor histidine kinase [Flavobacterium bernardetii]MBC5834321.1 PAS domain-containing sensor histidine kinase [Flavobacterium bernardetii]NHF70040.1 PAS domain S-box protein [Flavobacterium bernardetii]
MANNSFTYQELENQIVELKRQNEILKLHSFIQKEKRREYYYTSILNNIGDPVFVKDDQSRLLMVNDAFCEIFNLQREQIIGKTLSEDVSPEERDIFLKIDKQVLENGIENINEETLTVRGGETRIISTKKTRFLDADNKKYLVGVIHDITDRKKTENSLKELIATKDKLFSIVAHDLRSPFNSIIGFSELLIENSNDILLEDSEQYIKIINSSAKNTLILLDNLLNWAKSQTGQLSFNPEKILFSEVAQEIITLSKNIAKSKNIALECSCTDNLEIYVDVNMLNTVLRNLISNAIKFTNVGGHIKVSAASKQDHVEITISDNGIGIPKEKCNELFSIASNTTTLGTADENGSGLGLVLCKEFIQKNNGDIWVESEENKGSNFIFTLPIYKS